MFVISRKKNESVTISGPDSTEITVSIVEVRDDKVRLGITAPREMAVHRTEVHETLQNGTQQTTLSIVESLRNELRESKKEMERYRGLLAQWVAEPWKDVTLEQLKQEELEGGNIDDILQSLDQASAA